MVTEWLADGDEYLIMNAAIACCGTAKVVTMLTKAVLNKVGGNAQSSEPDSDWSCGSVLFRA
ncbi:hypothetical protein COT44_04995 [Candidatus Shapirobacteria bacterium CG08_land_8_20_14_0_20_39_18]|uniref:Uncharacterized protein n=1 Tax=Candidatus Shapirobacteria bacterium CG08_land_8_20_14_0_20_39_18 TaxID=1974883 RepID=A0A2M6XBT4_9BACT|nr:MAG: hypothetical protein COT44_04995 [Candidatus Shapirobacteria bacterium CG08_land_8_20_14_0_20_39_18]PIY64893.1 MAG: hypothetical protein COY91_04040 [Candidatus Shapirobacteria bacterium CG_4_10_14_0_8_um_filter_39_15]